MPTTPPERPPSPPEAGSSNDAAMAVPGPSGPASSASQAAAATPAPAASKAPPPAAGPLFRDRAPAAARVDYRNGSISYYGSKDDESKGRFQVVCGNPLHGGRCRLTRTNCAPQRAGRNAAQGRPLGLLAAWLACSDSCETKEDHDAAVAFLSAADRRQCRIELLGMASGAAVAVMERERRDEEASELEGQA